jgi:hypothetical protein
MKNAVSGDVAPCGFIEDVQDHPMLFKHCLKSCSCMNGGFVVVENFSHIVENPLLKTLLVREENRRLKRNWPIDLI